MSCINSVKLPIFLSITLVESVGALNPVDKQPICIMYFMLFDFISESISIRFLVLVESVIIPQLPSGKQSATCSQCFLLAQVIITPPSRFSVLAMTSCIIFCVLVCSLQISRPIAANSLAVKSCAPSPPFILYLSSDS